MFPSRDQFESDDFPYKRLTMSLEEVKQTLNNIRHDVTPEFVVVTDKQQQVKNLIGQHIELKYRNRYRIVNVPANSYERFDVISDYFNEPIRMRSHRSDQTRSPYEFWQDTKARIRGDKHAQREFIYKNTRECTTFKPLIMYIFIKLYSAKRILDPCSGWGDRLAGAIAAEADIDEYCGVDPNALLIPGYTEMIQSLATTPSKFKMICAPFETAEITGTYDLVFTSPPYFSLETYYSADSTTQSTSHRDWFGDFLLVLLAKAYASLRPGGHMCININDGGAHTRTPPFIKKMLEHFTTGYLGVILLNTEGSGFGPQPVWIWRK